MRPEFGPCPYNYIDTRCLETPRRSRTRSESGGCRSVTQEFTERERGCVLLEPASIFRDLGVNLT